MGKNMMIIIFCIAASFFCVAVLVFIIIDILNMDYNRMIQKREEIEQRDPMKLSDLIRRCEQRIIEIEAYDSDGKLVLILSFDEALRKEIYLNRYSVIPGSTGLIFAIHMEE